MSKQNKQRTAEENIFLRELRQLFITDLFELYIEAKTGKKIDFLETIIDKNSKRYYDKDIFDIYEDIDKIGEKLNKKYQDEKFYEAQENYILEGKYPPPTLF